MVSMGTPGIHGCRWDPRVPKETIAAHWNPWVTISLTWVPMSLAWVPVSLTWVITRVIDMGTRVIDTSTHAIDMGDLPV